MAKLSKREQAVRATKKKALAVPKVAPRVTASKSVSPLVGAGPLMTGQARVGGTVTGAGPLLPGQTRDNSYKGGSSRDMAAKAQVKKLNPASSVKAAEASGLLGTQSRVPNADSLSGGNTGFGGAVKRGLGAASSLLGDMGQLWGKGASLQAAPGVGNTPDELATNRRSLMGIPSANASDGDISRLGMALQKGSTPDMPTGYGDNGEIFFNGNDETSLQGRMRASGGQVQQNNPLFGVPTANASSGSEYADGRNTSKQKQDNWKNPWGDVDISGESQPEPSYQDVQNEVYGGGPQPDVAPPQVTRQVRGSGLFGTGKGVGNPAGGNDDPYIKELRKAYSSNGGEKWLRKQFEELIAALDPTYAQMQKEGTDALNQQLWNNNTQLASVMNANNTGDSEQRAQLMAGQQRDSQTALGNLLAKLSQAKAGDVSQYRSQMAEKMGQLQERKQTNAEKLQEAIRNYKNDKFDQEYKNASLSVKGGKSTKAGTLSYLGDDANGNPVYYNTTTGERTTEAGLKRKQSNPFEEALAGVLAGGGGGQGGSWEIDPVTNERVWVTD